MAISERTRAVTGEDESGAAEAMGQRPVMTVRP
jgi:hypothetical protein